MAVGTIDDPAFKTDLQNLDALVQKYGEDKIKAFAVVTDIKDGKSTTPTADREALIARAKALRTELGVKFPIVVPASEAGAPNKEFDDYYNVTKSRTLMFADGRNKVKSTAPSPPPTSPPSTPRSSRSSAPPRTPHDPRRAEAPTDPADPDPTRPPTPSDAVPGPDNAPVPSDSSDASSQPDEHGLLPTTPARARARPPAAQPAAAAEPAPARPVPAARSTRAPAPPPRRSSSPSCRAT
jgi:hypothetical protein